MNFLVKHVRDGFRRPFATLVATGKDKVGVAICRSDEQFKKKEGILRAEERAEMEQNVPPIPNQFVMVFNDDDFGFDIVSVDEVLTKEYIHMIMRSRKYFV